MTLLIALASRKAVYLSSDYRLSHGGVAVGADQNGAKQLDFRLNRWQARIAFCGIARVAGGYDSIGWLNKFLLEQPADSSIRDVVERLAARASLELQHLHPRRFLSILIATAGGGEVGLWLVANGEIPDGPRMAAPLPHFNVFDLTPRKPRYFLFGVRKAVHRHDRELLKRAARALQPAATVLKTLADINARAARQSRYSGEISAACNVSSISRLGNTESRNFGDAPGIPPTIASSFDFADFLRKNYRSATGAPITFVQSVSAAGYGLPTGLTRPPDDHAGQSWAWEHAETQSESGEWIPAIRITMSWAADPFVFQVPHRMLPTREAAREENARHIATSVEREFSLDPKMPGRGRDR